MIGVSKNYLSIWDANFRVGLTRPAVTGSPSSSDAQTEQVECQSLTQLPVPHSTRSADDRAAPAPPQVEAEC
jgi:hypothetical protein